jgi:hypothetical protein
MRTPACRGKAHGSPRNGISVPGYCGPGSFLVEDLLAPKGTSLELVCAAVRMSSRAPHCRPLGTTAALATALIGLVAHLLAPPAAAQNGMPPHPDTPAAQDADEAAPRPLARWVDAQAVTVATRYNYIGNGRKETRQNRLQTQVQVRGRFKIDEAGRYGLHAGLFTGGGFDSGWNPTGIGTGDATAKIYLKQLFVSAEPWQGLKLQYGSLSPARGQSTEITTYDNDAYVTAGRVSVQRPHEIFFDDITVSVGYVGYLDTPFVFDRTGAFSRQNYWQVLASKQVLPGLTLSTDYSAIEEDGMLHQGATWRVDQPWIDSLTGEYGVRLRGGSHQTAFALSAEKQVAGVTVEAGYANVDPIFGLLNGDRYGSGNRVFTGGSFPLPLDLDASWFVQKEISPPVTSPNDVRVDVILTWNVLKTLQRAGAEPQAPRRD